ncbi:MAG: hypothetical protein ACR2L4_06565 [Actinomycetota bacterium]
MPAPRAFRRRLAAFSLVLGLAVPALPGEVAAADPVIVAAGDIACPDPCRAQRWTTRLIRLLKPRAVLTLGDNQYEDGRFTDFMDSYRPTWGRFKRRTHPTPGNHDYHVPGARGYFNYFGRRTLGHASAAFTADQYAHDNDAAAAEVIGRTLRTGGA